MTPTYRHIKSGNIYEVISNSVIDASDGDNKNKRMVLYRRVGFDQLYVRRIEEFLVRFEAETQPPRCKHCGEIL